MGGVEYDVMRSWSRWHVPMGATHFSEDEH